MTVMTTTRDEAFPLLLGKLISNLQSLEFLLRAVLHATAGPTASPWMPVIKVGDKVPINAITNYDSLGKVIRKYNQAVQQGECVPEDLVDLRDALAHGRVSAAGLGGPLELVKYGREVSGAVEVEAIEVMDEAWLSTQVKRVATAMMTAHQAAKRLGVSP